MNLIARSALALLLLPWAAAPAIPAAHARNLAGNAAFQAPRPDGAPAGWIWFFPAASSGLVRADEGAVTLSPGETPGGGAALRISSDKPVRCSLQQSDLPIAPGQRLRFSVWMKGRDLENAPDRGGWARLIFGNRRDRSLQATLDASTTYLKSPAADFAWTRLQAEVPVPAGADRLTLDLFLWKSRGTVWYASPAVEVIDGPPAPPDARGDSSGQRRFAAANASLGLPAPDEERVVFLGDSITQGWNLERSFPGKGWVNRGIGGQMTGQMLDRFQDDVLALRPRVVVLFGGTNDLANGLSLRSITGNIAAMMRAALDQGIRPVVVSVLPVSDYHAARDPRFAATTRRPPARIVELNAGLASLCRAEGVAYVDLHAVVADDSGRMPAALANDGLHPNGAGYEVLSPALREAVERELDARR